MDTNNYDDLVAQFDIALRNTDASLKLAKSESLRPVAVQFYKIFQAARNALAHDGDVPFVPGNDPHNMERINGSAESLRIAMSGVYGFTVGNNHQTKSPHTMEALRNLQPISALLHTRDLAIFT